MTIGQDLENQSAGANVSRADLWNPENFETLINHLSTVDEYTEQAFLQLGTQIQGFYARASQLADRSRSSINLLQGEDEENTVPRLQLLVERCNLWLDQNQTKSMEICELLEEVGSRLRELDLPMVALRKVIKTVHSLRVTTRIEASKAYGLGAGVLAEALNQLGHMIQQKVEEIDTLTGNLVALNRKALKTETEIQTGPMQQARHEIKSARQGLSLLSGARLEISEWSHGIRGRSEEIKQNFGEMIAALQFQDITRQRLDHVQSNLGDLRAQLEMINCEAEINADLETLQLLGNICRLQQEQLQFAASEFVAATENLRSNLRGMSDSVVCLADDSRQFSLDSESGTSERSNLLAEILRSVMARLEKTLASHCSARKALNEVCSAVQGVASLIDDLEYIGEEMQLLALNAAVSAAHASGQGAGLEVIAQNIQELSEEATCQAVQLANSCARINEYAEQLHDLDQTGGGMGGAIDTLLEESQSLFGCLEENSSQLDESVEQISHNARHLAKEVLAVVRRVDIEERFCRCIQPVIDHLARLGESAGDLNSNSPVSLEELLGRLQRRYTMSSERDVHQRFMEERGSQLASETPDFDESGQSHGLGENVVLF